MLRFYTQPGVRREDLYRGPTRLSVEDNHTQENLRGKDGGVFCIALPSRLGLRQSVYRAIVTENVRPDSRALLLHLRQQIQGTLPFSRTSTRRYCTVDGVNIGWDPV